MDLACTEVKEAGLGINSVSGKPQEIINYVRRVEERFDVAIFIKNEGEKYRAWS